MFVQIIEGRTTDGKALMERGESWQQELRPDAKGYLGVTAGVTADGRAVTIVRFESEDAACANSERPEQGAWWAETAKLYDGEPAFIESSDVTLWMGGGLERRRLRAGDEDDGRRPGQARGDGQGVRALGAARIGRY